MSSLQHPNAPSDGLTNASSNEFTSFESIHNSEYEIGPDGKFTKATIDRMVTDMRTAFDPFKSKVGQRELEVLEDILRGAAHDGLETVSLDVGTALSKDPDYPKRSAVEAFYVIWRPKSSATFTADDVFNWTEGGLQEKEISGFGKLVRWPKAEIFRTIGRPVFSSPAPQA